MRWIKTYFDSIAHRLFWAVSISFSICWSAIYLRNFEVAQQDLGDLDHLTEQVATGWQSALAHQADVRAVQADAEALNRFMASGIAVAPRPPSLFKVRVWDSQHHLIYLNPAAQQSHGCELISTMGFFNCEADCQSQRGYRVHTAPWTIEVYASREDRAQSFFNDVWTWSSFEPFVIAFPLILIPVWFTLVRGMRPLHRLRKQLLTRPAHDISALPMEGLPSEVKPFVQALNDTFNRIDAMRQRERNFLANAAHEIRTPLALVQAQMDAMQHARTPESNRRKACTACDWGCQEHRDSLISCCAWLDWKQSTQVSRR